MLKRHSQLFEGLFVFSDLLLVSFAWLLSYWLRFSSGFFSVEKGIPEFVDYARMLIFVWLIWGFVFKQLNLYRPMRGSSRFYELWLLLKANSYGVVVLLAATYLFQEKSIPVSRLVFFIFWPLAFSFTMISRGVLRSLLRYMRRRGFNLRYALVVGSGDLAKSVMQRMLEHPEFGVELIGCLTRDVEAESYLSSQADYESYLQGSKSNYSQYQVVGTYSDLPAFLETGQIDQVIIAMPLSDHSQMERVIESIGDSIVDVRIVPDVHRFIQLGSRIEEFEGMPVISLASTPLSGVNRFFKRGLDLLLGSVLFVLLLPLMLLIALAVRLSSPGPILFSQERMGLDGHTFNIYKFRTMRTDAEREGARFAVSNDPRTTIIGKFLRRFSLDELPQLWNVIRGQMSLVGPRPERPVFISEFRRYVPRYMLRHKVQAGMTGWAQVNGWRGNTSIERRIEHDLYYIENWSLGLDLKILGLTLFKSFTDRNAY